MSTRRTDWMLRGVVAVVAIVFAGRTLAFLPALNVTRPQLAGLTRAAAVSPRLARRVVLVIADGLRLDTSRGLPFLDSLRAVGVDGDAVAPYPTLSEPNYVSMLSGIEPRWSGVRNNGWAGPLSLDSVGAGLAVRFATDHRNRIGVYGPWEYALPTKLDTADLVVLVPGAIDRAGHAGGGTSPAYRDAALEVDVWLRDLALDLAHDTVIVVADHGHYDRGGHGGLGAVVTSVPLVLAGAGIRRGASLHGGPLTDVGPTIAALLGVAAPAQATGRVLVDALELSDAARAARVREDEARAARLAPVLAAIEAGEHHAYVSRLCWSIAFTVIGLAILATLVVRSRRGGAITFGLDGAVPGLALALAYGAAIYVPAFRVVPFHLPGETLSLVVELAGVLGVAALAYGAALTWLIRRTPIDRRAVVVRGSVIAGVAITAVPAAVICAVAGDHLATMLPSPGVLMLSPLAAAGAATHSACALAALVLAPRLYGKVRP